MNAIILAAGRGSRMKELTNDKPKSLLKIKGVSLLQKQISNFKQNGIRDIAIVTGYKSAAFKNFNLCEFHNQRWNQTQMFFSLCSAKSWLENTECIVSYADIFYEPEAIDLLIQDKSKIALTYDKNWLQLWSNRFKNPLDDAESFKINNSNYLTEIGNKVKNINEIQGQYMGLLKFTPLGWLDLKNTYLKINSSDKEKMQLSKLLNIFIKKNNNYVKAIPYLSSWGEVDTIKDLNIYNDNYI